MALFKDKKTRQKANRRKVLERGCYFFFSGIAVLGFYYLLEGDFSSILNSERIQEKAPDSWFFVYLLDNGLFFIGGSLMLLGIAAFVILLFNRK